MNTVVLATCRLTEQCERIVSAITTHTPASSRESCNKAIQEAKNVSSVLREMIDSKDLTPEAEFSMLKLAMLPAGFG